MTAKSGGNPGGAARKAGGGTGKRVQGRSKGAVNPNKPGGMETFKTKKQTGGNRGR